MRPDERFPHDDPREWMNRARSNLARAKLWAAGVYLEDLCFDAEQAAEKAIKELLLSSGIHDPFIHDLAALFSLLEESGTDVRPEVFDAAILTRCSVAGRYPGPTRPVTEEDRREAVEPADLGVTRGGVVPLH